MDSRVHEIAREPRRSFGECAVGEALIGGDDRDPVRRAHCLRRDELVDSRVFGIRPLGAVPRDEHLFALRGTERSVRGKGSVGLADRAVEQAAEEGVHPFDGGAIEQRGRVLPCECQPATRAVVGHDQREVELGGSGIDVDRLEIEPGQFGRATVTRLQEVARDLKQRIATGVAVAHKLLDEALEGGPLMGQRPDDCLLRARDCFAQCRIAAEVDPLDEAVDEAADEVGEVGSIAA